MRALILAVVLALAVPATAAASTQYFIPPGNSGGSEYVESVPTAGGRSPTNGLTHHGTGGSASHGAISPSTQSSLSRYGSVGRQTAAFANQTGPAGGTSGGANGTGSSGSSTGSSDGTGHPGGSGSGAGGATPGAGGTGSAAAAGLGSGGSSPAVSVARSITGLSGHGGLGLLPVALLAVVLGIAALAWRRRRPAD